MPKTAPLKQNFTRGQLSPRMRGRNDLDFYFAGSEQQVNYVSDVEGSATYRLGTEHLNTLDEKKWFREFVFSQSESYAIGFGETDIVVYTGDGLVTTIPNSPYAEEDIPFLQIAQSADTMFIAHENYQVRTIVRTGANTFTFQTYTIAGQGEVSGADGSDNCPQAVGIYERRLLLAGTKENPQAIYGSKSFIYNDFTEGTNDDDAFKYVIGSDRLNRIKTITPSDVQAVIGTSGGNFNFSSGSALEPITPTNVRIVASGSKGTQGLQPVTIDSTAVYIQSGGLKVYSYEYVFESDGYRSVDRTVLSADITESGVAFQTFAQGEPDRVVFVRNDGKIANLVWKPEQSVFGWYIQETKGNYISLASLPQEVGNDKQVYCVEREVDGSTVYMAEVSAPEYILPQRENYFTGDEEADDLAWQLDMYEAQKEYKFVDNCSTYNGLDRGINSSADLTITVAAEGAIIDVVSSAPLFQATDVDGQIRARVGEGWGTITEFTSATEVKMRIDRAFDNWNPAAGDYYITADTITGLSHLEGEEVALIVDGASNEPRTVTGGEVTLSDDGKRQGSVIHVGLPYTGVIKTMNVEGGGGNGSSQSKRKIIVSSEILFLDSLGCAYGTDIYKTERLLFQSTGNRMNRPPLPFSGFKTARAGDRTERSKNVVILQDRPLPSIIQLVQMELYTSN